MSNLAVINQSKDLLSPDDIQILRNSKFKDFSDAEVSYSSKICSLLSLNPLLNQIHFVKRNTKNGPVITAQVGIDGYRLTAQRAGGYAGSDEPVFEFAPNDQLKRKPVKATVTVYRIVEAMRCAFTASARWDEFYPGPQGEAMWSKMPHNQLAKCAEALALRKAFPAELALVRTDEEMGQADRSDKAAAVQASIIKKEETEVKAEVAPQNNLAPCSLCQSPSVMISQYDKSGNTIYCKTCRKTSARG